MKYSLSPLMTVRAIALPLGLASQLASGALIFSDLATDASGNFVNPGTTGWTGDGTVVGASGYNTTSGATMINDFSGTGTLQMGATKGWGTAVPAGTTTEMTVTLVGTGTADISVSLGGPGGIHPMNFNVVDIQGDVTGVIVEYNLSNALNPTSTKTVNNQPFIAGFRPGGGLGYDVTGEYLGFQSRTASTEMAPGAPANFEAVNMGPNPSTFQWNNDSTSFSGTTNKAAWHGVNTFDLDNDGLYDTRTTNGVLEDGEDLQASGIRFSFSRTGGGSLAGASFTFSLNGTSLPDSSIDPIPEPSGALLLGMGLLSFLSRRKR